MEGQHCGKNLNVKIIVLESHRKAFLANSMKQTDTCGHLIYIKRRVYRHVEVDSDYTECKGEIGIV